MQSQYYFLYVIDLNVRFQSIRLLEENIGENCPDFLTMTPKTQEKKN